MTYVEHSVSFKLAVLKAHRSPKWSKRQIAEFFEISPSSIYRWDKQYKDHSNFDRKVYETAKQKKINSEISEYIIENVEEKQYLEADSMIEEVKEKFNTSISQSSIYNTLKKAQPKLTYKKVSFRDKVPNPIKMKIFIEKRSKINRNRIISLDECSFDTHMTRHHGWAPVGQKCVVTPDHTIARERFSLMLSISSTKVVAWEVVKGSYNQERFLEYIDRALVPNLKRRSHKQVVLMDNCPFHHSKRVKAALYNNNLDILYNPPYNPDSNPIEMLFAFIKGKIRKAPAKSESGLKRKLKNILDHIDPAMLNRIFRHSELT